MGVVAFFVMTDMSPPSSSTRRLLDLPRVYSPVIHLLPSVAADPLVVTRLVFILLAWCMQDGCSDTAQQQLRIKYPSFPV